jgi:hypothetical protein
MPRRLGLYDIPPLRPNAMCRCPATFPARSCVAAPFHPTHESDTSSGRMRYPTALAMPWPPSPSMKGRWLAADPQDAPTPSAAAPPRYICSVISCRGSTLRPIGCASREPLRRREWSPRDADMCSFWSNTSKAISGWRMTATPADARREFTRARCGATPWSILAPSDRRSIQLPSQFVPTFHSQPRPRRVAGRTGEYARRSLRARCIPAACSSAGTTAHRTR